MSESDDRFQPPPPPPVDPDATQDAYAAPEVAAPPADTFVTHDSPVMTEAMVPEAIVPADGALEAMVPAAAPIVEASVIDSTDSTPFATRIADELIAWLKTLASAAVYATLIVTFGFQVARVEGQSMAPTLQDQDRLIVNKLAYRLGEPQIGDIVMLYYPTDPKKSFVKRVIAQEGDTIRMVDGKVYRNDVLMDDSFVPPDYRGHDDLSTQVIKEGYYFVMGDHRNNSSDSRHWGLVPKKYIIGRVQLRWWPLPEARTF